MVDFALNSVARSICVSRYLFPVSSSQMSSVNSEVTRPKFTKFYDVDASILYAINAHIEVTISYFDSECQSDE